MYALSNIIKVDADLSENFFIYGCSRVARYNFHTLLNKFVFV